MEKDRKIKIISIVALVLAVCGMSLGFAAFSTSLKLSSSAMVTPDDATFSVKFSTSQNSLVVGAVTPSSNPFGLTTSNGTITNGASPTLSNVSATFTSPGQYVEYTYYARNEGEYTAYLNNINFLGDKTCIGETGTTTSLVTSACDSIIISTTVGNNTYTETTLVEGHTLAKGVGEQIKIRLEYLSSGTAVDGAFSIKFPNVALVYSTLDDSSIQPAVTKVVKLVSGNLNDPGSIVSIGDEQFYVIGKENGNVKLLSMYNLRVGNSVDDELNVTPLTNTTGIQDSEARGYVDGEYPFIGTTAFSNTNSTYSGSIVEGYVNNYKTYLTNMGVDISSARLITKAELEKLGCNEDDYSCSDAPSWVYSTSYWSGSAFDTSSVWTVDSNAGFDDYNFYADDAFGVRPVIEISESEF